MTTHFYSFMLLLFCKRNWIIGRKIVKYLLPYFCFVFFFRDLYKFTHWQKSPCTAYSFEYIYFTTPCTRIQNDMMRNEKSIIFDRRLTHKSCLLGRAPCARLTLTSRPRSKSPDPRSCIKVINRSTYIMG